MPKSLILESLPGVPVKKGATISPGWCGSVVERWPVNQRVTSLIPNLGHMPGLWARSPVGGA